MFSGNCFFSYLGETLSIIDYRTMLSDFFKRLFWKVLLGDYMM
jgi:hypothetical protein